MTLPDNEIEPAADLPDDGHDPEEVFKELARVHQLLAPGETTMGDRLWQYTMAVVSLCAAIGDAYGNPETGADAGEHIRAKYFV